MAATTAERLIKLETELAMVLETQTVTAEQIDKLVLVVQDLAQTTRHLQQIIEKMEPHVTTVANAKTFWEWSGKLTAFFVAVGGAGYGLVVTLKPFFVWR